MSDIWNELTDGASVVRLSNDLRAAISTMSSQEVRYLVDAYYQIQRSRIRSESQIRAASKTGEPHSAIAWFLGNYGAMERQLQNALDAYSDAHPIGQWMRQQTGIGPVISSGLLAHIDINRAPTVGHIWSYAGLIPGVEWKKGEKRPWNSTLKALCAYKLGESFVKVQNRDGAIYGVAFKERKAIETAKNDAGDFADQAKATLERFRIGKDTEAYKQLSQGRLPKANIHARARRWAVKKFLSDLHYVWYRWEFGIEPPAPYPISMLGHAHAYTPPGPWPEPKRTPGTPPLSKKQQAERGRPLVEGDL